MAVVVRTTIFAKPHRASTARRLPAGRTERSCSFHFGLQRITRLQPTRCACSGGIGFIGTVRLKYLALATVLIDLVSIPASNAGGHIAHIGGALFGFAFARMLAKGRDISRLPLPRKHHAQNNSWPYGQQSQNKETRNEQQLNHILDKISRSGYNSLSRAEKKALFKFKDQTDA